MYIRLHSRGFFYKGYVAGVFRFEQRNACSNRIGYGHKSAEGQVFLTLALKEPLNDPKKGLKWASWFGSHLLGHKRTNIGIFMVQNWAINGSFMG